MEIRKKLLLIIAISILATAVPGGAAMYAYTQHQVLKTALIELEASTGWIAGALNQRVSQHAGQVLSGEFRALSAQSGRYPGTQHFVIEPSGNFLLAGAWQSVRESQTGPWRPDLRSEPELVALFGSPVGAMPRTLNTHLTLNDRHYIAIGTQLTSGDWRYFNLTPLDEITAPSRHLFLVRAAIVLVLLILGGTTIAIAVGTRITRRITVLRDVMQGHTLDSTLRFPQALMGHDEIGEVGRAYNTLADDVDRNITARIQAQAQLAGSEELWRFALEGAGYGVWDWNLVADTVTFSQRSQDMLGVPAHIPSDVQNAWLSRIHPDDRAEATRIMREHLYGGATAYAGEYRVSMADGTYKWVLNRGRVVTRDANGKPVRVIGTHTDISIRKDLETRLADGKLLLQTLLRAMPDLVWLKDVDGTYLACNQRFEQFFGASEQAILGKTDYDFIGAELADFFRGNDMKAMRTGGLHINEEWITFAADGHKELLETTKLPVFGVQGQLIGVLGIGHDVTHSHELDKALKLREQYQRALLDTFPYNVWLKDEQSRFLAVNERFAAGFGWPCAEALIGKNDLDITTPELAEQYRADDRAVLASGEPREIEEQVEVGGEIQWHETYKTPVSIDGRVIGTVGFSRNITARKKTQEALKLAASVFSHAREAIMITSADGVIFEVNDAFTRITGYSKAEVLGQNPRILSSGRQSSDFYAALWKDLHDQDFWYGEVWNRRKTGEVYAEMQTISAVRNANGVLSHYVSLFSDITATKEQQRQLEHIAHFDALTNLPNRVLLADRLHQALTQCQRRSQMVAVAYLDLDGFKAVNDQYGHDSGDRLLISISAHMKHSLREGDTLARIGGDEFVVLLTDLADTAACKPLLTRLLEATATPVEIDGVKLQVSASVGVSFYPQTGTVHADQLLRQADQAMYQAKSSGKNRYHFYLG